MRLPALTSAFAGAVIGLVVMQALAESQAQRASVPLTATETPRPYPTCINRFWLEEPTFPCTGPFRTLNPLRAATATADTFRFATFDVEHAPELTAAAVWRTVDAVPVLAGIDRTPCPTPPTPIPFTYWEAKRAPCFWPFADQTREARYDSGEMYSPLTSYGPDGSPTLTFRGTVPAYALTAYAVQPATETAAVATARALATAGLPDRAERNDRRRNREDLRRWNKAATATTRTLNEEGRHQP
jgi:hypothetical protein